MKTKSLKIKVTCGCCGLSMPEPKRSEVLDKLKAYATIEGFVVEEIK